MAYLDQSGLDALWARIKGWANSVHAGSMTKSASSQDGLQLILKNGAPTPAQLSTVTITKGDITALGIPGSDTTYTDATQTAHGLMSAADKKKLDGVEANANHYVHPTSAAGAKASGLYKVATDAQGHVTGATAVTKSDISPLESDPTVPSWAKAATKPSYNVDEIAVTKTPVGFSTTDGLGDIISGLASKKQDNISDLATIRAGAAKGATAVQTETDPTVPAWAKAATKPTYKASEITNNANADFGSTVAEAIELIDSDLTNIDTELGKKAPINTPTFTGTPHAPTAAAGTNTTQIATTAFVHSEVAAASMGAAKYQGDMTPAKYTALTTYKQGWYWIVTEAGTIAGESCEIGDMVFCNTDNGISTGTGVPTKVPLNDAHFDIVQNNIDAIPLSVINALS